MTTTRTLSRTVFYKIQWRNKHYVWDSAEDGWTPYGYADSSRDLKRAIETIEDATDHPRDYDFRVVREIHKTEVLDWAVARLDRKEIRGGSKR